MFSKPENPKKEISMYINSPGGVVTWAWIYGGGKQPPNDAFIRGPRRCSTL